MKRPISNSIALVLVGAVHLFGITKVYGAYQEGLSFTEDFVTDVANFFDLGPATQGLAHSLTPGMHDSLWIIDMTGCINTFLSNKPRHLLTNRFAVHLNEYKKSGIDKWTDFCFREVFGKVQIPVATAYSEAVHCVAHGDFKNDWESAFAGVESARILHAQHLRWLHAHWQLVTLLQAKGYTDFTFSVFKNEKVVQVLREVYKNPDWDREFNINEVLNQIQSLPQYPTYYLPDGDPFLFPLHYFFSFVNPFMSHDYSGLTHGFGIPALTQGLSLAPQRGVPRSAHLPPSGGGGPTGSQGYNFPPPGGGPVNPYSRVAPQSSTPDPFVNPASHFPDPEGQGAGHSTSFPDPNTYGWGNQGHTSPGPRHPSPPPPPKRGGSSAMNPSPSSGQKPPGNQGSSAPTGSASGDDDWEIPMKKMSDDW